VHLFVCPDVEQEIQVLFKQRVVVFQVQPEQRERVDERAATDDHFGTTPRDQIERRELLKESDGVDRTEDRDGAREPNAAGPSGRGRQNDRRGRIQVFLAMVFTDAEDVEACLVGVFDLLQQLAQTVSRDRGETAVGVSGRETVDADLHGVLLAAASPARDLVAVSGAVRLHGNRAGVFRQPGIEVQQIGVQLA
jgi:hypothetical protein